MFNNLFGLTCIRPGCGHKNPKGAEYCENCGISLAFNRPAILEGNEWQPAPDELAAFFKFKDMKKGFFTKTLWVPAGMKAWVLQDDADQPVRLLGEGALTTETLFQRMNNFFRSPHGEVLVARTGSVPFSFAFDNVLSLERLALKATVTLRVRVRVGEDKERPDLAAFRRHFMQQPGVVTAEQLARPDLLGRSVHDALKSFVGARGIDEMAASPDLNDQLDLHLRKRMVALLMDLGLELVEPGDFTLRHEKLDEHNRMQGELWLLRREKGLQQQHVVALSDLYDAQEREKLRARRLEIERKRLAGELDKDDAELAHAMRLREVEQYEKILAATTREQAARMGAADEVGRLEQEFAAKRRVREQQALGDKYKADDEQTQWRYLQDLVRVRRDLALKLEAARLEQELLIQRERAGNELRALRAEFDLAQAKLLADAAEREAAIRETVEASTKARLRSEQLKDAESAAEVDGVELASEVRRIETARMHRLEDAEVQRKIHAVEREHDLNRTNDKLATLKGLIDLDNQDELNKQRREDERLDKHLERTLLERRQQQEHLLQTQRLDLERVSLTGSLPMESLVLLADDPLKIDALVRMATLRAHGQMSPDAIVASVSASRPLPAASSAIGSVPASLAPTGPSPEEKARSIQQDERNWLRDTMREQRAQNAEFLDVIKTMTSALRDVGVANAGAPISVPPTVAVSAPPVASPAPPPTQPAAAPAVLQQAFVACRHCRTLNAPSNRYCSSCGQPMA